MKTTHISKTKPTELKPGSRCFMPSSQEMDRFVPQLLAPACGY